MSQILLPLVGFSFVAFVSFVVTALGHVTRRGQKVYRISAVSVYVCETVAKLSTQTLNCSPD
jgi:hypothetical protein